ncbi:MAG: DUF4912 domain-containing protein [bacterium]
MGKKQADSSQKAAKIIPSQKEHSYIEWGEPLPEKYGDTRIVLLPRDPRWVYAYWEINNDSKEEIKTRFGEDIFQKSRLTIRVYDVTNVKFDGFNAHRHFDIGVTESANNWYINTGVPDRSYCVDLGLLTLTGEFIPIARSNIVRLPRESLSPVTDQAWMQIRSELEKLMELAGLNKDGISSAEAMRVLIERIDNIAPVSSGTISSLSSSKTKIKKVKGFWLMAETEIVLHGATERDAELTIQGESVPLNPDGTFSVRFVLPDGKQEIPVVAVSKSNGKNQKINITLRKNTK